MLAWIASQRDQVAPTETSFPKLKRVDQGTREGMSIRCLGRRGISDCWCFCWGRHFGAPLRSRRIPLPAASPTRTGRSPSVAKTVIRVPPGNRSESSRSSIMTGRRVSRYRACTKGSLARAVTPTWYSRPRPPAARSVTPTCIGGSSDPTARVATRSAVGR